MSGFAIGKPNLFGNFFLLSSFVHPSTHPPIHLLLSTCLGGVGNRLMDEMDMMSPCPPCGLAFALARVLLDRVLELWMVDVCPFFSTIIIVIHF